MLPTRYHLLVASTNCRVCYIFRTANCSTFGNEKNFPISYMTSFYYGWMDSLHTIRSKKYHLHERRAEFKCIVNFNFLTQNRLPFCTFFYIQICFFCSVHLVCCRRCSIFPSVDCRAMLVRLLRFPFLMKCEHLKTNSWIVALTVFGSLPLFSFLARSHREHF